jgi:hypothetical protein
MCLGYIVLSFSWKVIKLHYAHYERKQTQRDFYVGLLQTERYGKYLNLADTHLCRNRKTLHTKRQICILTEIYRPKWA